MNKKLILLGCLVLLFCMTIPAFAEGSTTNITIEADGPVTDVCFSQDNSKIVFAVNNVINLCKSDGTTIKRFGVKDGPTIDVMDYSGNTIAAYAYTNPAQIDIWDENGQNIMKLGTIAKTADETVVNPEIETAKAYRMQFTHDGKSLLIVSTTDNFGGVKLRDLATGKVKLFKGYDDTSVYGCCFSVDGSKFATISRDEQVKLWDPAKGTLITTIVTGDPLKSSYYGKDVAMLSNGTIVVVKSNELSLWSDDGKLLKKLEKEVDSTYKMVRVSRDGNLFAVAYKESGLALYTKDGSLLKVFQTEGQYSLPSEVTGISFSSDNKFMAVATNGGDIGKGTVKIYAL